jgi:hypothetical protein
MALRMMVYVGLLYQDLIRQKQLGPDGLLPPVLPIVLYNGEPRWRTPTELSALLPRLPGFLAALQPQMRYLLIDEGAGEQQGLADSKGRHAFLHACSRAASVYCRTGLRSV